MKTSRISSFFETLGSTGIAVVDPYDGKPVGGAESSMDLYRRLDENARLRLAGTAPQMEANVAHFAAKLVYRACQFILHREVEEEQVRIELGLAAPLCDDPAVFAYSADLALRHLPRIFKVAHELNAADPLVASLRSIAQRFPLSSVGIPELEIADPGEWYDHPSLRALYHDRIIAAKDKSRLSCAKVREAIPAAWGLFGELGVSN